MDIAQSETEDDQFSVADFEALIAQVRAGDNEAAQRLISEYAPCILRAVRRRMNSRIRERYDSQDFEQAVWASFFLNRDNICRLNSPRDLVHFLSRVASNKVIDAGRKVRFRTEERVDDVSNDFQPARDRRIGISEPTPSQNFVARESWDRILADESEADRRVISLRLQGYTQQEIAEHLEISERTVRRTLHRLMKKIDTA